MKLSDVGKTHVIDAMGGWIKTGSRQEGSELTLQTRSTHASHNCTSRSTVFKKLRSLLQKNYIFDGSASNNGAKMSKNKEYYFSYFRLA
jgi:hypothetical protein